MATLAASGIKQSEHFLAKMTDVVEQVLIAHGMLQTKSSQMQKPSVSSPAIPGTSYAMKRIHGSHSSIGIDRRNVSHDGIEPVWL